MSGSHTRQELSFELSSSANRGETRSSQVSAGKEILFEERQNRLVRRGASIIPRPWCRNRFSMFHGSVEVGSGSGNVSDPDAVIILSDLRVVVVGQGVCVATLGIRLFPTATLLRSTFPLPFTAKHIRRPPRQVANASTQQAATAAQPSREQASKSTPNPLTPDQ